MSCNLPSLQLQLLLNASALTAYWDAYKLVKYRGWLGGISLSETRSFKPMPDA